MRLQKRFCIRLIVSNVVRAFLQIEYMVLNIYTSVYKHINCVFYRSVTVCLTSSLTTLNSIALFHKIYPIGKLRLIHTICPATFFLTAHIFSLSLSLSRMHFPLRTAVDSCKRHNCNHLCRQGVKVINEF